MPQTSPEPDTRYHHAVAARAIALMDRAAEAGEPPLALDDLAREVGLSPAHLHRVFSGLAGISPLRYQQHLRLGPARALLAARQPVQEVAAEVGLSGAGRLHDLFVRWEAMTPGAYARGGEGVAIREGVAETPFGPAVATATEQGLCGLGFAAAQGVEAVTADLRARWPRATYLRDDAGVAPLVEAAFAGGPASLHLRGGPFQLKVWEALLAIPEGAATSYGALARAVGAPGAARAVGQAVGANPVAWLIPCHRVLRGTGAIGGYRWGLPIKRRMLAWEAARAAGEEGAGRKDGASAAA